MGALIVRDPGVAPSADDHVFFLKGLHNDVAHPSEVSGQADPDTLVLHVGRPARLRLFSLNTDNPAPSVCLTARLTVALPGVKDTMVVRWRPVTKDGFDVPAALHAPRLACQLVSIGETYDFEYLPKHAGRLRLEVRPTPSGQPWVVVPIRIE